MIFWQLLLSVIFCVVDTCTAQEVQVQVMGLFHPSEMVLHAKKSKVLVVHAEVEGRVESIILNGETGHQYLTFSLRQDGVHVNNLVAQCWSVAARDGAETEFDLEVPGKLRRTYLGRLQMVSRRGMLEAVVEMGIETAVASIVGAEIEESAPLAALRAQAVVTRSYLSAAHRHLDFDFCDTTHCQFLKSPPAATSPVAIAVSSTRGMVLSFRGRVLAAMFSSRCGGHTKSLHDIGYENSGEESDQYPYYIVDCEWCLKHPLVWQRYLKKNQSEPQPADEKKRIKEVRKDGWNTIPGNDFSVQAEGSDWHLVGHNAGHGVGMCQYGAIGMANAGADYRAILVHYYPNTSIQRMDSRQSTEQGG